MKQETEKQKDSAQCTNWGVVKSWLSFNESRLAGGLFVCLLEVAGLLLVLLPPTHLQVPPPLKQVGGFHPGRQAERLVEWGRIPMAMFFPINHVSTGVVNWRSITKMTQTDQQGDRKLQWLLSGGTTDATGSGLANTKTAASTISVNSCPWNVISLEMMGRCDLLWAPERHH